MTECDVFDNFIIIYMQSGFQIKIIKVEIASGKQFQIPFNDKNGNPKCGIVSPGSNLNLNPKTSLFYHDSPFHYNESYEVEL